MHEALVIEFYLKKPEEKQNKREYITISNPKKVLEGKLAGIYACEVYLPEAEKKYHSIYADNPIEVLCFVSDFVKGFLQGLINRGFTISEPETNEPWKLEKKDPQTLLQEKIEAIKNSKDISAEDKQKILKSFKEIWGYSPIKDQINKLI